MAKRALTIFFILSLGYLFLATFRSIQGGFIPFWYDPSRDLQLAAENLRKISLIGPPSGIPGIFYLPYWTWYLSVFLIFTRDPRWITLFTTTLPYFLFMPLLFYGFRKTLGTEIVFCLCLIFFLSYNNLINQLWSPNLGPLFYLATIYLISVRPEKSGLPKIVFFNFIVGIITGVGIGFNMAFGIVVATSTVIYYFIGLLRRNKIAFIEFVSVGSGIGFTLIPYFLFEARHGFNQSKAFLAAFAGHSGVILAGLSKTEIMNQILIIPQRLLHLPQNLVLTIFFILIVILICRIATKKIVFIIHEKRLIVYLFVSLVCLGYIYFISKNPKWEYHFIGLEILFLLLIGLAVKQTKLTIILMVWTTILLGNHFITALNPGLYKPEPGNLVEKQKVVNKIYSDANITPFSVSAYSPAIYTYDYDYLFKWMGEEKFNYLPENQDKTSTVYLIIPKTSKEVTDDFINYKTPGNKYTTVDNWTMNDGTLIVKRNLR